MHLPLHPPPPNPFPGQVYQMLSRYFRGMVECVKGVPRWMHGTCEATPPLFVEGEEEPIIFSFYDDVSQDATVHALIHRLDAAIQLTFEQAWPHFKHCCIMPICLARALSLACFCRGFPESSC